jgi:transcriptional regulator with XRE-family HTH domain
MKDRTRVSFQKGEQAKFLINAKKSMGLTWEEIANFCGVSRSMVFIYLSEKNTLPKNIVEKICSTTPNLTKPTNCQYFELSFSRGRKYIPKLPVLFDERLAEFTGTLLGDGHLGPVNHEISITGDRLTDEWYIKRYVSPLIESLFGIKPFIYKQQNPRAIRCKFYSYQVFQFLVEMIGLQAGEKKCNDNVMIPPAFFTDAELLKSCLRGLFDTDGGFYRHHVHSATVEVCNHNVSLLNSVRNAFASLGFRVSQNQRGIRLYQRDCIHRFFEEIGSNNPKHFVKYEIWRSTGVVPTNEEILRLLINFSLIN